MLRTQISLTEDERRVLAEAAARTGRSMSSLIRDAVRMVYGEHRDLVDDLAGMRAGFGAWGERELDGAGWVEQRRSGARLGEQRR